jgi:YVTN family beta-propeller protein
MSVGADLPVGGELAGYRVEALVGRGGMGVVYRALDLALDRPVAIKILAPELAADVQFRERFLRESRLAASIDHPNIVPVYDAGEVAGELYLAMRYVEGSDLKRLLANGPLEPGRAVGLVSQVAAALDAAHARGLVHRDVKPSNVLVTGDDHVYLADFGLTKRLDETVLAVDPARSLGTADYVAPEQIRGDDVDGRADLYSLGCVLYECLTGQPPFGRDSELATLFAHLEEEPRAPAGLESVIRTALAKEPDDRYQSGRELVEATRSALGLEPKKVRWPLAIAAVGLALLGAGLLAFFLTRGGAGERPGGSAVRLDAASGRVAETVSVGQDPESIAASPLAVWVGNFADATVSRIDPTSSRVDTITVNGAPVSLAVADGTTLVADGAPANQLTLIRSTAGYASQVVQLPQVPTGGTTRIAAGREGFWLANNNNDTALRLDVSPAGTISPGPVAALHPNPDADLNGIAVGDGSVWVVGSDLDPRLWRIDPANGRVSGAVTLPIAPASVAAGDGGVWIAGEIEDTLLRVDPVTLKVTARIPVGSGGRAVAVGAGAVWVANAFAGTVSRVDPAAGSVERTIRVGGSPLGIAVAAGSVWVARGRT